MYGGDEYIVVVPVHDEEFARKFMELGYIDERGENRKGQAVQIREDGEHMRRELRETFPDFPKDRLDVKKGHFPGRLSVGWHYLPEEAFCERFQEYQLKKTEERRMRSRGERVQNPVTFLGMIAREADRMLYEVKQRDVREALSPGGPPEIVPRSGISKTQFPLKT